MTLEPTLAPDDVAKRYPQGKRLALRVMRLAGAFSISGAAHPGGTDFKNLRISREALDEFEKQDPLRFVEGSNCASVCYFVRSRELVKIGWTHNLALRMSGIATDNPHAGLLFTLPGGANLETALHAHFRAYHHSREWFRLEGELLAFVQRMGGGA